MTRSYPLGHSLVLEATATDPPQLIMHLNPTDLGDEAEPVDDTTAELLARLVVWANRLSAVTATPHGTSLVMATDRERWPGLVRALVLELYCQCPWVDITLLIDHFVMEIAYAIKEQCNLPVNFLNRETYLVNFAPATS